MTQSQSRPRDDQQHFLTAYPHSLHSDADYFGVFFVHVRVRVFGFKTTYGQGERERERKRAREREGEMPHHATPRCDDAV